MPTRKITIRVDGPGLHEVTREVSAAVAELGGEDGLCTVFIPHTSASLTIQENADPSAQQDLERWLERLVPEGDPLYTGMSMSEDEFVTEMPLPVTAALLERGRGEFGVFCSPCHGRTGRGDGVIVQRGFQRPSSFHIDRLRQAPIGYYFDVMSNGFGAMSDYAMQVPVEDRWAIAAYVRALQLSQHASFTDVPAGHESELEASLLPVDAEDAIGAEERH